MDAALESDSRVVVRLPFTSVNQFACTEAIQSALLYLTMFLRKPLSRGVSSVNSPGEAAVDLEAAECSLYLSGLLDNH